ncbi:hypothetical protein PM082_000973 [Marasmius tenuissimus]|nr:hypothetical protein PM082_000973 [Marasmius tenuissimus]
MYSARYPAASPPHPVWRPQPQVHLFPHNPYPQPYQPPRPIAHKVWIIDCKSCGTFLTNRGMKAVLLLHPSVALFSSDALPVNCSAYSTNPDVLRPATSCRPPPTTPARTCECLTQTLCCHGCGAAIGYMIVIPCIRCTSSITATNRATNGHRFVFHSSEVTGTERHYIPDEPGIMPFDQFYDEPTTATSPPSLDSMDYSQPTSPYQYPYEEHTTRFNLGTLAQSHPSEYLPTPPIDLADLSPASSTTSSPIAGSFPFSFTATGSGSGPGPNPSRYHINSSIPGLSTSPPLPPPPPLIPASSSLSSSSSSAMSLPSDDSIRQFMYRHSTNLFAVRSSGPGSGSGSSEEGTPPPPLLGQPGSGSSSGSPLRTRTQSPPPSHVNDPNPNTIAMPYGTTSETHSSRLKAGDVLYWHHLIRRGEIPGVANDPRARKPPVASDGTEGSSPAQIRGEVEMEMEVGGRILCAM